MDFPLTGSVEADVKDVTRTIQSLVPIVNRFRKNRVILVHVNDAVSVVGPDTSDEEVSPIFITA
jgi:hypothetical protein